MPYLCSVKHSPPNKASLNTRVNQPSPCGDGNCIIPYVATKWILWTYLVCSHFGWVFDFCPLSCVRELHFCFMILCSCPMSFKGTLYVFHDFVMAFHISRKSG